jgi:uncharacterized protein
MNGGRHGLALSWGAFVVVCLCWLLTATVQAAAPHFPRLTGRVVDAANVLSAQAENDLTQKLAALEATTTRQLVVVTLPSLEGYEIEDYGYQLGRAWGVGEKSSNNGVLFIVAPSERRVRIEVGYGLEPVLTDALSAVILQQRVLPRFRTGDIEGGIVSGTDALIEQLSLDTAAAQARALAAEDDMANPQFDPIAVLLIAFFVLMVILSMFRGTRGRNAIGWMLPIFFGGGFGRGAGGGFSGGGGSFGGGGASGRW